MQNKDYYFQSLSLSNYRSLKSLDIKNLRRINLIGGFNGSGKTSLLEALFLLLDRRSPAALARPYATRNIGFSGYSGLPGIFSNQDKSREIKISASTRNGPVSLSLRFGRPKSNANVSYTIGPGLSIPSRQDTSGERDAFTLESTIGSQSEDMFVIEPKPDGISVTPVRFGQSPIPTGVLLTTAMRGNNEDISSRYSDAVREGRVDELLEIVRDINPDVVSLQLLHEAGSTVLHAKLRDGAMYPTPMLGDGFLTLLSITLMIMATRNGVVLLDEFDSAIHYSALADVWSRIASLAGKYSCQIFAVTHSMDCIKSAFEGVRRSNRENDFQYIRLERREGENSAVIYNSNELYSALSSDWEVR